MLDTQLIFSLRFGPWHRPYLALYEQIVSKLAQDIVNEFPAGSTKTKYQDAVQKLRLPYWDWAAKLSPYFPPSLALPTIGVTYPNGTAATIANPLFSYKFHPFNATEITTKAPDTETRRSPGADGQTNMAVVESGFQDDGPSLRTQIYNLLTTYQTYNQFSTFAGGSSFGSIGK